MTLYIDTLAENRYQIKYNSGYKSNIISFFKKLNSIKYYSFEYTDSKSIINWTSEKIIIQINEDVNIDSILNQLNITYTNLIRDPVLSDFFILTITEDMDAFEKSNALFLTGDFVSVKPSFFFKIPFFGVEDNPFYIDQKYLGPYVYDNYMFNGINVEGAWDITTGDPNVKIAILDNGVRKNHPDIINNIFGGYDATSANSNSINLYGDCLDSDTHGTQVAGIIGAENNSIGIVGIAYTSKIIPIRISVSYRDFSNGDYTDWWYSCIGWITDAFQYCVENDVSVINGSWGCIYSDQVDGYLYNLSNYGRNGKGTPLVFSTGNDPTSNFMTQTNDIYLGQTVFYPAINDNTIAVGGINTEGGYPYYNCGKGLDIVAPSKFIKTTTIPSSNNLSYYRYSDGTSMAAPQVSATIALMLSVNPNLTYSQIKEILYTTTNKLIEYYPDHDPSFHTFPYGNWDIVFGYGLLNAHAAIVESAFYGIPLNINGSNNVNLCDEIIMSVPEFDIPEWVESVSW